MGMHFQYSYLKPTILLMIAYHYEQYQVRKLKRKSVSDSGEYAY